MKKNSLTNGFSFLAAVISVIIFTAGCSKEISTPQPADGNMHKSFKVADALAGKSKLIKVDREQLSIHSSALKREFLLQGQIISQPVIPLGSAIKSRVVFFKKKSGKVYLLESSIGHIITDELPQALLLAEFDILEEKGGYITLDFNKGMSKIFVAGEFFASDLGNSAYKPEYNAVETGISYLDKINLSGEQLEITQIAQVRVIDQNEGSIDATTLSVKYYLTPYRPSPDFAPREGEPKKVFGYFEVAPTISEGRPKIYSMRFNEKKKITFAVSANTPNDFKEAVAGGVLYWNNALGEELIQVVEAPETETAPSMNYNIIQWVDWDDAGFAYADAQADPRTGEVLHAQVYVTSAFAVSSKLEAQEFLASFADEKDGNKNLHWKFGLKGFKTNQNCLYKGTDGFRESLTDLLASGEEDAAFLKAAQDFVREVTAHEVGHTLGLRHNFAGSHGVSYKLSERGDIFKRYFTEGKTPEGVTATSSVMDYISFVEGAMTGDMMKAGRVMSHDEKAIKHLYFGKDYNPADVPTFCTDSHAGDWGPVTYIDCKRFDVDGKNPAEAAVFKAKETLEKFPQRAIEYTMILLLQGYPLEALPLLLSPLRYAYTIVGSQKLALDSLTTHAGFASVRRNFYFPSELYDEKIHQQELALIEGDFAAAGGVSKVLKPIDPHLSETLFKKFKELLVSNKTGIMLNQLLEISGRKQETLDLIKKYFEIFQREIVRQDLILMGRQDRIVFSGRAKVVPIKFMDHGLSNDVADTMLDRVLSYSLSQKGETHGANGLGEELEQKRGVNASELVHGFEENIFGDDVLENDILENDSSKFTKSTVVPEYVYDFETRKKSMSLLMTRRGESIDWGWEQRQEFNEKKQVHMTSVFPSPTEDLKSLSRDLRKWVLEWKELEIKEKQD